MVLTEYLYIQLLDNLKDKMEQVIQGFHSNLSDKLSKFFVEIFF